MPGNRVNGVIKGVARNLQVSIREDSKPYKDLLKNYVIQLLLIFFHNLINREETIKFFLGNSVYTHFGNHLARSATISQPGFSFCQALNLFPLLNRVVHPFSGLYPQHFAALSPTDDHRCLHKQMGKHKLQTSKLW